MISGHKRKVSDALRVGSQESCEAHPLNIVNSCIHGIDLGWSLPYPGITGASMKPDLGPSHTSAVTKTLSTSVRIV